MDANKINEMTDEEITQEIADLTGTLFKFRFQHAMGQVEAPSKIRVARRQVARLKTAQRARAIKASAASA